MLRRRFKTIDGLADFFFWIKSEEALNIFLAVLAPLEICGILNWWIITEIDL